jgi:hypothetical protein
MRCFQDKMREMGERYEHCGYKEDESHAFYHPAAVLFGCHRGRDNIAVKSLFGKVTIQLVAAGAGFIYKAKFSICATGSSNRFI